MQKCFFEMKNSYSHPSDDAERAMIYKIVGLVMGAPKTDPNIEKAYDFIESDEGEIIWDAYYGLFAEGSPSFVGPKNKYRFRNFLDQTRKYFKKWEKSLTKSKSYRKSCMN